MRDTAREEFREKGFVLARGILSPDLVDDLTGRLERLSGRTRVSFASERRAARLLTRMMGRAWTLPDGVTKRREFWPLIWNPLLLRAVREVLGDEVSYLQHSDLHVGFSALTWHRDSVNRTYAVGPDWDERQEEYRIVRVGIYLQRFDESGFALGLVPGSHRLRDGRPDPELAALDGRTGFARQAVALLAGRDPVKARAEWVQAECGDAIVFDPRILHAGSSIRGAKFSLFLAFGVPGAHFARHQGYYRHTRRELGYEDVPEELKGRLAEEGLLAESPWEPPKTADSFVPSRLHSLIGRRVRSQ